MSLFLLLSKLQVSPETSLKEQIFCTLENNCNYTPNRYYFPHGFLHPPNNPIFSPLSHPKKKWHFENTVVSGALRPTETVVSGNYK